MVSGCKNPLNQYTSQKYYKAGNEAENKGNYQLTKENYSRALINSKLGGKDKRMEALALYELSRVTGYLGDYKESEKGLLEVIELSKSPESKSLNTPALCELARLYFDTGQYQESIPIFVEANHNLKELGVEKNDPLGYCLFLKDYKIALENTENLQEAQKISEKLEIIKNENSGSKPLFIPKRYKEKIGMNPEEQKAFFKKIRSLKKGDPEEDTILKLGTPYTKRPIQSKEPNAPYRGESYTYYLHKENPNLVNEYEDKYVTLSFDTNGKLAEITTNANKKK